MFGVDAIKEGKKEAWGFSCTVQYQGGIAQDDRSGVAFQEKRERRFTPRKRALFFFKPQA